MKMCLDVQTGVGRPHRIQRHRGGDTTQNQSRLLAVWMAGWLAGLFNDYSANANPGSILQAETCKILS